MTNGNDAAYARTAFSNAGGEFHNEQSGLTKREFFAAMAMQGICASITSALPDEIAFDAVKCADTLIDALNKKKN